MFRSALGLFSPTAKMANMTKPKYQHIINPPVNRPAPVVETRLNYADTRPSLAQAAEECLSAKEQAYLDSLDSHFELPAKTP
jgi:hypothetical protein